MGTIRLTKWSVLLIVAMSVAVTIGTTKLLDALLDDSGPKMCPCPNDAKPAP